MKVKAYNPDGSTDIVKEGTAFEVDMYISGISVGAELLGCKFETIEQNLYKYTTRGGVVVTFEVIRE